MLAHKDYAAAAASTIAIEKAANCAETSSGHDAAGLVMQDTQRRELERRLQEAVQQ